MCALEMKYSPLKKGVNGLTEVVPNYGIQNMHKAVTK